MGEAKAIADLSARVSAVEDELAIIRLIASYGPLVDSGWTDPAPALFAEDGVYDVDGGQLRGSSAIAAMLGGEAHQSCVASGIAHAMGLPWVRLDGDAAIATNTTQIFLREGEDYRPWRIAQNTWHLVRDAGSGEWRVRLRFNRLVGRDGEAVRILREAIPAGEGRKS